MSVLQYLQLQPVEPSDDDDTSTSPLDDYQHDDTIDLTQDADGEALESSWDSILQDLEREPDTQSAKN